MVTLTINGIARTDLGKKATKAVRNAGLIPCVLYGTTGDNVHFTVGPHDVRDLIYTGEFKIAEVHVDGKAYKCLLKDVQFDPVTDSVTHIDFLGLQDGRTIKVEVPLRFVGSSPGVRNGGKFQQSVRKIKIKTKPEFLVDEVIADISKLKLGQSIRVRDIKPTDGVEILNPAALPVAMVAVPRSLKGMEASFEEEETEEVAGEAAE